MSDHDSEYMSFCPDACFVGPQRETDAWTCTLPIFPDVAGANSTKVFACEDFSSERRTFSIVFASVFGFLFLAFCILAVRLRASSPAGKGNGKGKNDRGQGKKNKGKNNDGETGAHHMHNGLVSARHHQQQQIQQQQVSGTRILAEQQQQLNGPDRSVRQGDGGWSARLA